MANRDLIVIGASAGGIEALQQLCAGLPGNLDAAVLVILHTAPSADGLLPRLLTRAGPLLATNARDGEAIEKGRIYVAKPDHHLIVGRGFLKNVRGPRENHSRPAIDPTFRSSALAYGSRVIGVVLTGLLDDGTSGLMVIRAHGGAAVVQDPQTAMFPSMPRNALARVPDAVVANLAEMPKLLRRLVAEEVVAENHFEQNDQATRKEVRLAEADPEAMQSGEQEGKSSPFACPECGGVLWEINQNGMLRYRCRVGHAFTSQHLQLEQRHRIETALWSALRALEENAALQRRMAARAESSNFNETYKVFEERARAAESNSQTLRDFLVHMNVSEPLDQTKMEETSKDSRDENERAS